MLILSLRATAPIHNPGSLLLPKAIGLAYDLLKDLLAGSRQLTITLRPTIRHQDGDGSGLVWWAGRWKGRNGELPGRVERGSPFDSLHSLNTSGKQGGY